MTDTMHTLPSDRPAARKDHLLAYRVSTRWFGRRYYFAVFAGEEKRCATRTFADGENRAFLAVLFDILAIVWMLFLGSIFLIGLAVTAAYLVKSGLGIDLFDGHFPLHDLFFE